MKNEKKNFYRNFFMIFIALVLQNVITISVNLADNIMLGSYSETSLAGVAAVNQIQFVYQQILTALGDGIVIFGSQYWGKKQIAPMKRITAIAMRSAFIVAIVLFVLICLFPYQAVGIFTTNQLIIEQGVQYLSILKYTYVFFAITQLLLAMLRMVETVQIAFVLSMITFFINCGINAVLIFGRFGFPAMGAKGAAIGTLIARIVECMILLCFVGKKENTLNMKARDFLARDKQIGKDYFKITMPIVFVQGLWGLNTAMQTVILGHMTAIAIAANSVASTLFLLVKSMTIGAASTASIIIGKAIGEGNKDNVMTYSSRLQRIFLSIGILGGIILFFIKDPVLNLYNLQVGTKMMAKHFLTILSVVFVGMSYQMPTNTGIIRGGGSTMFVVKIDLVCIWMLAIPLSFFMAFVVKASPEVVIFCLNIDQIIKCIPGFIMSHYGNWIKTLTREQ